MDTNIPLSNEEKPSDSTPNTHISLSTHQVRRIGMLLFVVLIVSMIGGSLINKTWEKSLENPFRKLITPTPSPTSDYTVLPTTTILKSGDYKIVDGSVYEISSNKLLINRKTLKSDTGEVIGEYAQVRDISLSPDNKTLLFLVDGYISISLMYTFDTSSEKITYVSFGDEAVWSPNSTYIAYTSRPADSGPTRLYVYDIKAKKEKETTMTVDRNSSFSELSWSLDSKTITAKYISTNAYDTDVKSPNDIKVTAEGVTTITLK